MLAWIPLINAGSGCVAEACGTECRASHGHRFAPGDHAVGRPAITFRAMRRSTRVGLLAIAIVAAASCQRQSGHETGETVSTGGSGLPVRGGHQPPNRSDYPQRHGDGYYEQQKNYRPTYPLNENVSSLKTSRGVALVINAESPVGSALGRM